MTERNSQQYVGVRTQSRKNTTSRLMAVRETAQKDKKLQFTCLMHHITSDLLYESFQLLKRQSAAGIDGIRWKDYQTDLGNNLEKLYVKVQSGKYRPRPARRVFIPKEDGSSRPLSILCLEDKIVQQAVVLLLNAIYETDFLGFSYGFRPGRGQHDALDALNVGILKKKVNWVLDLDISKFFDTVEHDWLIRFIKHRIKDRRVIRLIWQWLKVGVLDEHGNRVKSVIGTPQGAVVSPLLANIYLHYTFDLWTHRWRKRQASGHVVVIRYADDVALGFQHRWEAERYLTDLHLRMSDFGLTLHPSKTRLIRFGRFAISNIAERGMHVKPETFNFLGFTHICGKTARGGFVVKRCTVKKRLRSQLKSINAELKKRMHAPIPETGRWLRKVVQGHINYYGVPFNRKALSNFHYEVKHRWFKVLRRRGQKKRINWQKFGPIVDFWIPKPLIVHPYPEQRFFANTQGRSRMC